MRGNYFPGNYSVVPWERTPHAIPSSPAPAAQPPPAPSQRIESLPDPNYVWWELYTKTAAWFIPPKPKSFQPSQRWDPLPDFRQHPTITELPYVQWFIPPKPPLPQRSQRWDTPPDYRQEPFITERPFVQWFRGGSISRQASQQWWILPDFSQHPTTSEPEYAQWYIPQRPPTQQSSQRWDALPDFRQEPIVRAMFLLPPNPPLYPPSQRIESLPDWWMYAPPRALPPILAQMPRLTSQQWFALLDYWQEWTAFRAPFVWDLMILYRRSLTGTRAGKRQIRPRSGGL